MLIAKMSGPWDIILFGATGYTGLYCIRALYNFTKVFNSEKQSLTWAIAGRSKTKLVEALEKCQAKLGKDVDLRNIPIITADVNNYDSLKHMSASARVIVNCCGPYRFFGEPVVKACIETGTHQIDVSGEPEFMERMVLKYNELAKEKGVYIISSCGYDSIPHDLGVLFLEKHFDGTLNAVESFSQVSNELTTSSYGIFNYATWESAIYGMANGHELQQIRSKLNQKRLPSIKPKLQKRALNQRIKYVNNQFVVPIPASDRSVVLRTQRYLYETKNKRPVQFESYNIVKSRNGLLLLGLFGGLIKVFVQSEYGRRLLLKFPEFFTNGYFTRQEKLSDEMLNNTKVTIQLLGTGWDANAEKLEDDPINFKDLPNKTISGTIEGYNPSYGIASAAAVLSAIVLLLEKDKLPFGGGVYTPGVAFGDTSLVEQLQKHNILKVDIKSKL